MRRRCDAFADIMWTLCGYLRRSAQPRDAVSPRAASVFYRPRGVSSGNVSKCKQAGLRADGHGATSARVSFFTMPKTA
jgi:hypothetical protein